MIRSLIIFTLALLTFWQCANDDSAKSATVRRSLGEGGHGEQLAKTYCQTCHLFPSPELLDKATWRKGVLPNMGARMGIRTEGFDPFQNIESEERKTLDSLGIYPNKPALSREDWSAIVQYYEETAPAQLPSQNRTSLISEQPPPFSVQQVDFDDGQFPKVSLLEFDQEGGRLFIGNGNKLYALSTQGAIEGTWETHSPSTDISIHEKGTFLLSIGSFDPSEKKEGVFFPLSLNPGLNPDDHFITELPRPVNFAVGDLNEDGQDDLLICGFGNHTGKLVWYDGFRKDKYQVLSALPGARKAEIIDLNGDGLKDIIVLMAQAWEKVLIYYNRGEGEFEEETLLEFPALHGSSYIELADFNKDGHQDILLTNGDNWDYSTVDKPYHGLRLYLNDGHNRFKEAFFYPMYGCSEVRAVDFDHDGDLDIAAIAFYNNSMAHPEQGFVYLENNGQLNFTAHYMQETASGKWLSMDIGDFNGDGFEDIFLGSYFHNMNELARLMAAGEEVFPEVLMLVNEGE